MKSSIRANGIALSACVMAISWSTGRAPRAKKKAARGSPCKTPSEQLPMTLPQERISREGEPYFQMKKLTSSGNSIMSLSKITDLWMELNAFLQSRPSTTLSGNSSSFALKYSEIA